MSVIDCLAADIMIRTNVVVAGSKRKSDGSFPADRSKASLYGNFVAASSASNETSSKSDHNETTSNEASSKCEDEPPG